MSRVNVTSAAAGVAVRLTAATMAAGMLIVDSLGMTLWIVDGLGIVVKPDA